MPDPFAREKEHDKRIKVRLCIWIAFIVLYALLPKTWTKEALASIGAISFLYFFVLKGMDSASLSDHLFSAQSCGAKCYRDPLTQQEKVEFTHESFLRFMEDTKKRSFWW